jgi:hypothetical protein
MSSDKSGYCAKFSFEAGAFSTPVRAFDIATSDTLRHIFVNLTW